MGKSNPYKGIPLDRTQLQSWIKEFANSKSLINEVSEIIQHKNSHHRCTVQLEEKIVVLDFYYTKDGTTTIQPLAGKHQDLKIEMADYILKKVHHYSPDLKNMSFSINDIEKETFEDLIEYLEQLKDVQKVEHVRHEANTSDRYKFTSSIGDRITLIYYDKKKLQIQGKPLILYSEVTTFLSAFIDFDEVVESQSEFLDLEITPGTVREEMKYILPNAYDSLGENAKKLLASSFALQKTEYPFEDYSPIIFPAFRALESYLKQILLPHGILIKRTFGEVFHKKNEVFIIIRKLKEKLPEDVILAAEEIYNYFKIQRHGLFHASVIDGDIRIIETKQEAETILAEVLRLIETTSDKIQLTLIK